MSFKLIAIDGPSGVGKSTTAQRLAERLGYYFLSSGRIYRALAWFALQSGWQPGQPVEPVLDAAHVTVDAAGELHVDGARPGAALGSEVISAATSQLSTLPAVRERANQVQREAVADIRVHRRFPGVILEGRDIGTVVFPDATHKFFLTASTEERARRRYEELADREPDVTPEGVRAALETRDERDSTRAVAPLRPADDAVQVDTTALSLEAVVAELARQIEGSEAP